MELAGNPFHNVGFGFRAGRIAHGEGHGLLWVTGPEGNVCGFPCAEIRDGTYAGGVQVSFDTGQVDDDGEKVASFLTVDRGELYVGSCVDGADGRLNRYLSQGHGTGDACLLRFAYEENSAAYGAPGF